MRLNLAAALILATGLTSACKTAHVADFIATPADRLVCEAAGPRPKIPPEYAIDWSKAAAAKDVPTAVALAQGEVAKLLASVHSREGTTVAYVLALEGKNFICFSNMQWRKDFEAELARSHSAVKP